MIFRTACLIVRDPEAAADIAQETFVRAYRAGGPSGPSEIRPWLYRIATNLALNLQRSRRREERALSKVLGPHAVEDGTDERLTRSAVAQAVRALPDRLRMPVVLRYYADLSEKEIARAMGLRQGTVKSRLHDARRLLAGDDAIADVQGAAT